MVLFKRLDERGVVGGTLMVLFKRSFYRDSFNISQQNLNKRRYCTKLYLYIFIFSLNMLSFFSKLDFPYLREKLQCGLMVDRHEPLVMTSGPQVRPQTKTGAHLLGGQHQLH